ncbi:MAG: DUF6498-containing protein [Caulobacterales bacterium]
MLNVRGVFQDLIRYPSLVGTIAVNFLPTWGVVFWGWGVSALVLLYWLENVVLGGVTVVRMAATGFASAGNAIGLLFVVPFFLFHYGLFCFVHGIFVMAFFAGGQQTSALVDSPVSLFHTAVSIAFGMPIILTITGAWRLLLVATQFIWRGEYLKSNPMIEMGRPYGRIVTLHFAIFAGAFAMMALGQPAWGMFALIALKTAFDFFGVRKDARGDAISEAAAKSGEAFKELQQKLEERWSGGGKKPPTS